MYGKTAPIKGYCSKPFREIEDAFKLNFLNGMEREGANLAVFHQGKLVLNLYGGIKNSSNGEEWGLNTKTFLFSTTKAITSLCVAVLVDQGHLSYDDLVVKYWPEYGISGKENTTLEHVLTHMAGIPYTEEEITLNDARNESKIFDLIEQAKPIWVPGQETGYHAITFGWMIDAIIRRSDPKKRSLRTFFREEIAEPNNLDIDLGCEQKDFHKLTKISQPSLFEIMKDIMIQPLIIPLFFIAYMQPSGSPIFKMQQNPSWLAITPTYVPFNDPQIAAIPNGAISGVSNSRNVGKLFSLLINGHIVSNKTLKLLNEPTLNNWHLEQTTLYPVAKGRGFFWDPNPTDKSQFVFGHPGYGCQGLHIDRKNNLVIVYLSNGLKSSTSLLCVPYQNILKATYSSIQKL
uniref:Beta-lactamase domain-containing protein n=1 Tax=Rhabditophanes sp. KR3021 TaxID=114890 RepID=A0AC35U572_9BILA